jgi:uncharacterized protein (UPF0332 family)
VKRWFKYWWEKAESSLESARLEFEAGAYDFTINRLYYTAFYGVSAVLLEGKISFKKHSGVRAYFYREFIKERLIEVKWCRYYDKLFEDRQEGDYKANCRLNLFSLTMVIIS